MKLWDIGTGDCLRTFEGHTSGVTSVCFSPNGRRALSGSYDKTMKLWDISAGACLRTFEGHTKNTDSVCFSPDGRQALSGSDDKTIRLWRCPEAPPAEMLLSRIHSADETAKRTALFHSLAGEMDTFLANKDIAGAFATWEAFRKERLFGDSLTYDGLQKKLARYGVRGNTLINQTMQVFNSEVYSICFSPDGHLALSESWDKTLKLWDISTGVCLRTFEGHRYKVESICFSPDGRLALSGSWDKTLKLWDIGTGACLRTFEGHTAWVYSVCFSPDGRLALSGVLNSDV
jgi:WD40 repeat protein